MRREYASIAAMAAILVGSQALAIALSPLFFAGGFQAFSNPADVTNTAVYIVMILAFTAVILGLVRYRRQNLAEYDAWAVYRTKHMITLADELTSQRLPILLVIPKKAGYSFREQKSLKEQVASGEEREAMFIGLGDLIIPGILSVSSFTFPPPKLDPVTGIPIRDPTSGLLVPDIRFVFGLPSNLFIAICAIIGCLVGFTFLMRFVLKGKPQAGLPLLNGGTIAGYLLSFALVYGTTHWFGLF